MELVDKPLLIVTMYKGRLYTFNITYENSQDERGQISDDDFKRFENRITDLNTKNIGFMNNK